MELENKNNTSEKVLKSKCHLYPIIVMLVLYPLIVKEITMTNHMDKYPWYPNNETTGDLFLFGKLVLLVTVATIMGVIILWRFFKRNNKYSKSILSIPLFTYAIFVILSTIFSDNRYFSIHGMVELYEPVWVILGYCILFWYVYQFVATEDDVHIVMKALLIGVFLVSILGVLQVLGISYFDTNIGKLLIFGKTDIDITFNVEKNRVTSTIFNPNYVGVYTCLLFPVTLGSIWVAKSKTGKILSAIISAFLVICTFGARSKTGLVIIVVSVVIMLALFRRRLKEIIKWVVVGIIALVVTFIVIDQMQGKQYSNSIKDAMSQSYGEFPLESVITYDEYVKINYKSEDIYIKCELDEEDKLLCMYYDAEGNPMQLTIDDETMRIGINEERFAGIYLTPQYVLDNELGFSLVVDNREFRFKSRNGETGYKYITSFDTLVDSTPSKGVLFNKYTTIATGRGYIWSRTIPLLKDTIFLGTGPDTFVLHFPQTDYAGKVNNGFGSENIAKPHNLYMQIGVQTGVISLIAFLTLYFIYFVSSVKLLWKSDFESFIEKISAFILIGTLSYMISGLINDSCISVAPFFWILLGLGASCSRIIIKNRNDGTNSKTS